MLFLNLPARDLATSRTFYTALGFSINEFSSDDGAVSVVVDDTIVVTLRSRERFADLVGGEVGDPAKATSVVVELTLDRRADVDDLADKALAAGGQRRPSPQGDEDAYTRGFADPDGNAWLLTYLSPRHVID